MTPTGSETAGSVPGRPRLHLDTWKSQLDGSQCGLLGQVSATRGKEKRLTENVQSESVSWCCGGHARGLDSGRLTKRFEYELEGEADGNS